MVLYVDGEDVMVVGVDKDKKEYERKYQEVFDDWMRSDAMSRIKELFYGLNALEHKIQRQLEEILISRDYINYRCRLCPGYP